MMLGVVIQCNTMHSSNTPTRSNVGILASTSHLTRLSIRRMKQSVWCVAIHSKIISNIYNVSSIQIIIHSQIVIIHIIAGIAAVSTTTRMILQHQLPLKCRSVWRSLRVLYCNAGPTFVCNLPNIPITHRIWQIYLITEQDGAYVRILLGKWLNLQRRSI